MKIDRLMGITLYLLNREVVSASELAEQFEVSKRTIQRDIDDLNLAGIPVVATRGSAGGYGIIDGFKLEKQVAGQDDYLNIITALKGLRTAYRIQKVSATLEKMTAVMPKSEQRVFIDLSAAREGKHTDEYLRTMEAAIRNHGLLKIEYTNAEQHPSTRVVEPLALTYQWYAWYLFAFCTARQDYRLFKLSRVLACAPANGTFSRQHGDVEALLKEQLAENSRRSVNIRLLCKKDARQPVLEYLNGEIVETYPNGDFVLAMHVPENERMWFSLLMSFGDQVQVIEPEEVKTRLRQKAEEILSVYPSAPKGDR